MGKEDLQMKNLLLSWASGGWFCNLPEFKVYLKSISTCGFEGDVIFFTHDMPEDTRKQIHGYGYKIIDIDPKKVSYVNRDRFLHYWEFLTTRHQNYQHVIHTDSKDVYFQEDPIKWLEKDATAFHKLLFNRPYVALVPEGMIHSVSPWNMWDQHKCQQGLYSYTADWQEWPVINSGTIAGSSSEMKELFMLIWSNAIRITDANQCTDQGVLNYLYHTQLHKDCAYQMLPIEDNHFCATGEAVCKKYLREYPTFNDNKLIHPNGRPYAIFHQWERTEFRDKILGIL